MRPWPLLILLLPLLSACGPLPQPFRHEGMNALAAPQVTPTIVLSLPASSPEAQPMAQGLIDALADEEIPATQAAATPRDWRLGGTAERNGIRWDLTRADGSAVASVVQPFPPRDATPKAVKAQALSAAARLANAVRGPIQTTDEARAQPTQPLAALPPSLRLRAPSGLPGDGDKALAAAMERALRAAGYRLVEADPDYTVSGRGAVIPGNGGQDEISLAWSVAGRDGRILGTADQQGPAPRARLSGTWGALADDIAEGGAIGVMEIVDAARRKTPRSGRPAPP